MEINQEQLSIFRAQLAEKGMHCGRCNASADHLTPVDYIEDTANQHGVLTLKCEQCGWTGMNAHTKILP